MMRPFFSSLASCSRAISWGSFMRDRCTARTRIGFSRRSPCKVVSDGLEKEGRKKDASNDRAAILALLLCFGQGWLTECGGCSPLFSLHGCEGCLRGLPERGLPVAACRRGVGVAASASCEAFRTALCPRGARGAGQSRRRWERWLPEILVPCRNCRGRARRCAPSRGSPRTRASLDLVRPPEAHARIRRAARAVDPPRHQVREMTVIRPKPPLLHAPTKKELVRRAGRAHAQNIRADVRDGMRIRALHHGRPLPVTTPAPSIQKRTTRCNS